jgi:hypothetical protein
VHIVAVRLIHVPEAHPAVEVLLQLRRAQAAKKEKETERGHEEGRGV